MTIRIMFSREYRPVWGGISRMTEHRWEKAGKIPPARYINGQRARTEEEVQKIAEELMQGDTAA